jgi:hypothetical protein
LRLLLGLLGVRLVLLRLSLGLLGLSCCWGEE